MDFARRVPGLQARDDWQVGLVNLPNKILHVLSRALPADNRSKARVCVQRRVLAATPIYEPVKLYDGGFRYLMNERMPSLSNVTLQEPAGFLSPNLRCEYVSVYWCEICRSREHNSAGKFCCPRKLPIENKFPRKDRAIMKRMTFWISKFRLFYKKSQGDAELKFYKTVS